MSEPDETWAAEIKGRAASILCEAGALCGWPAPNCNAREGAEALYQAGLLAARSTVPEAGKAVDWREAMQLAIDYLKETKHGSPARSAGHNARLVLEAALAAPQAAPAEDVAKQPLSRMSADDGRPMWEQISDLIKFHMNERPPIRLRDELVTILAWARYGEARLTASEAEAASLRRKLEEAIRDRDEKIARALNQADIEAERAGNALNDLETAERKLEEGVAEMKRFALAYVNLMEVGRDRIMSFGGTCDPVDVMERGDPALNRVKAYVARTLSGASE
jgi:hypothetical protein